MKNILSVIQDSLLVDNKLSIFNNYGVVFYKIENTVNKACKY